MIGETAGNFECAVSMLKNGVKETLTGPALRRFRRILFRAPFE
jgi:hypothetical protein